MNWRGMLRVIFQEAFTLLGRNQWRIHNNTRETRIIREAKSLRCWELHTTELYYCLFECLPFFSIPSLFLCPQSLNYLWQARYLCHFNTLTFRCMNRLVRSHLVVDGSLRVNFLPGWHSTEDYLGPPHRYQEAGTLAVFPFLSLCSVDFFLNVCFYFIFSPFFFFFYWHLSHLIFKIYF